MHHSKVSLRQISLPAIALIAFTLSCRPIAASDEHISDEHASEVSGVFGLGHFVPTPKRAAQFPEALRTMGRLLGARIRTSSIADIREHFSGDVLQAIIGMGGVPRWQLKGVLHKILLDDQALCHGANCARVFGIRADGIDEFLDDLLARVQKDSRLHQQANLKTRDILIASLSSDIKPLPKGRPDQVVPFRDRRILNAKSSQGSLAKISYRDLDRVTWLEVDLTSGPRLDELTAFPKLKTLIIKAYSEKDVLKIVPGLDTIETLAIQGAPFTSEKPVAGLKDLEPLAFFSRIKTVRIEGFDISQPWLLPTVLPHVRHLTFESPFGAFNDAVITNLSQLPDLRRLSLLDVEYREVAALKQTLPKSVVRIDFAHYEHPKYFPNSRDYFSCGNLSAFSSFRNASTMTLKRCDVRGLGPFSQPMSWQILQISQSTSPEPLVLNLPQGLDQLRILSVEDSPSITVPSHTLQELNVRNAREDR